MKPLRSFLSFMMLLVTTMSVAQFGPMGFGNADGTESPVGFAQPRLLLWLDGSSVTVANGQNVTVWPDKSGNGHDFLADPAWSPIFRSNGGPANRPYVEFSRADNRMYCEDFPMLPDEYTVYFVVRSSDNRYGIFSYGTASEPQQFQIFNDDGVEVTIGSSNALTNINDANNGAWGYGGIMHDMGSFFWQHRISGEAEGTSSFAGSESISPTGTAVIGNLQQTLNGGFLPGDALAGDIAEIIVWGEALSRPHSRLMRSYLWSKYGSDFRRNGNNGWDKFWGYSQGDGRYYEPIAVGRDNGNPNPGEHCESRLEGLVLRVNPGQWTQGRTYLCAGHVGATNSIVTTNLPTGVQARWSRVWEIGATNDGPGQQFRVGFDFGEGINGSFPQVVENFVLLRRLNNVGTFSEVPASQIVEQAIVDDEVVFTITKSNISASNFYYTIGTKNSAISSLDGSTARTWYAFQSGNWDNPATWTLDGSAAPAYVNPGSEFPSAGDNIVIGSGRTVTVNIGGINQSNLQLFGTFDVGTQSAPTFTAISGNGTIRCAGNSSNSNFPIGNTAAFADPINGGRVEFYGSGSNLTQATDLLVNRMEVNFSSPSRQLILASTNVVSSASNDLTHNGTLEITNGTLVIHDGATVQRNINSNGDVFIASGGRVRVNASNRSHRWNVMGNIFNDGDVRLTQRTSPNFSNPDDQGRVALRFINDDENQDFTTNGIFYLWRLVVDKGLDKTYKVEISSNAPNQFRVFGECTDGMPNNDLVAESGNDNAVALINGTCQIRENIFLPLQIGNGGNYNINRTAALWVDGGVAAKGAPLVGPGNSQAIVVYGEILVTDGQLRADTRSGITLRGNGLIRVEGGELYANQIRTSIFGPTNIGGYIQTGGDVYVDGSKDGDTDGGYYVFSLSYTGNLFQMSGGNLYLTGANSRGMLWINSDPAQTSVSGGTIYIDVSTTNQNYTVTSRAPLWNLVVTRSIGSGTNRPVVVQGGSFTDTDGTTTLPDLPLYVNNSLSISGANAPTLRMGSSSASPMDLFVQGSMSVSSSGVYEHFENTTHFLGNINSFLLMSGNTKTFHNVIIDKDTDTRFAEIQTTSFSPAMDIQGGLNIERGFFENNNRQVLVRGNVVNRSRIGSETSTGDIVMQGVSGRQEIFSQSGIFHGLVINNLDGVALLNDGLTIRRRLRFSNGHFIVGDQKLQMETNIAPFELFGASKHVVCSGNPGAGGVEVFFHSGTQNTTFPIGVPDGAGTKYTPATIVVNGNFVDSGYVQIAPVDTLLPTVDVAAGGVYLNYFWRVTHSQFDNLPLVSHRFDYISGDVVNGLASDLSSGRVLSDFPFSREVDDGPPPSTGHVSASQIFYNGTDVAQNSLGNGTTLVNANYSAGFADRFIGRPLVFYSRDDSPSADWNAASSWNELGNFGPTPDVYDLHTSANTANTLVPGPGSVVFIGFDVDDLSTKRPHSYAAPTSGIEAAEVRFTPLQDPSGNRLPRFDGPLVTDLTLRRPTLRLTSSSQLTDVQQISGEGTILLTGDVNLSLVDLGGFLSEDSSIVMLQSLTASTLSLSGLPSEVPNLFITSGNNGSINGSVTLNNDIEVRGDLEVIGNANLRLSNGSSGNISVNGDLIAAQYQSTSSGTEISFAQSGSPKVLDISGDLQLSGSSARIEQLGTSVTPPAPVAWTPDEIGAILWLDASDNTKVTTSGSEVTSWANSAAGSYTALQTTSSLRPVYQTAGLNGLNTVRFDGIDDFLSIAHNNIFNISAGQDFEIFTVCVPQQKNSRAIYSKGGVHSTDLAIYYWSDNYRIRFNGAGFDAGTNTGNNQDPNIGWVRRQSNSGVVWNTSGGFGNDSGISGFEVNNTKDVTIGALDEGIERFFDGDIAEIVFVKRALSTDERQRMEGYLAHKWGLTGGLPNGHPFKSSPPITNEDATASHQLEVRGDIIQDITGSNASDGLKLHKASTFRKIKLALTGDGNHSFQYIDGPVPDLWSFIVDKGFNTNSSFAWNSDLNVFGPSDQPEKAVQLVNGLLEFNDPNIDLTLASGGGSFTIPGTAGIELNGGTLRINNNLVGLLLDGSFEISDGVFEIGNADGDDNFIEYSSNATARITVSGGDLIVGSQIRRGLTNTAGILDYRQSGGNVLVGLYAAPALNRGVFEVTNTGSRFDHIGGTLTLVRGVNSPATPSLLLTPDNHTISGTAEIRVGNVNSPAGADIKNFGIQASVPINRLSINNDSGNDPEVRVQVLNLQIQDLLDISAGSVLACGTRDLIMNGDIANDGLLSSSGGTVFLNHPTIGDVSGAGLFSLNNLERQGGAAGLTTIGVDLVVSNNFANDEGDIDFSTNQIEVRGNVFNDGHLIFDQTSDGVVFNGSSNQLLEQTNSGTAEIDVLTVNNSSGVSMPTDENYRFTISKNLRLERGVFDLSGNLLELGVNAVVSEINPFGENNMISTGGAFTNFGVRKFVPANSTTDVFIPLGIDRYMPVRLDFSAPGFSSGSTASDYLFRLNIPENPIITNDTETPGPQINDFDNVLGMYFSMDASNVGSGIRMDAEFQYDDDYVQVVAPATEADYIGARVYSDVSNDFVFKFGTSAVDEVNNIIRFSYDNVGEEAIDGEYFAGLNEAIPDFIPAYTTAQNGNVQDGLTTYTTQVPGGGAPSGARVNVVSNHVLSFNTVSVTLFRIDIGPNATVSIDAGSIHRLGTVTGSGTIKLNGTGNLPSGSYNDFFTCFAGQLVYEGGVGDDYEILSNLPLVRKVDVIGSGNIRVSNNNVEICEDLTIDGPTFFASSNSLLKVNQNLVLDGGTLNAGQGNILVEGNLDMSGASVFTASNFGTTTIEGDMLLGGATYNFGSFARRTRVQGNVIKTNGAIAGGASGASLVMEGSSEQFIEGSFTGVSNRIRNLEIANASGVVLHDNAEVVDTLRLTNGKLFTGVDSMIVLVNDGVDVVPSGGSPDGYVDGPMQWTLAAGSSQRVFPVGKNERYRPLRLTSRSAQRNWVVEYFDTVAVVNPAITSMDPFDPLVIKTVSIQEHWSVNSGSPAGTTTARVGLSWGQNSAVAPAAGDFAQLVVLGYNSTNGEWDSFGGSGHSFNAGINTGTFAAVDPAGFSERFFTLGSSDAINPLPVTFLHFYGETDGENHTLLWATGSETNNDYFELERSIDGVFFQTIANIEGAGTSNTRREYRYVDRVAPTGRVYYRLKQVDFNGDYAYADEVVTLVKDQASDALDFKLFPNPTTNREVRLMISDFKAEMAIVRITDISGKLLAQRAVWIDEQGISDTFATNFEPGVYIVSVMVNGALRSKPLVVSK